MAKLEGKSRIRNLSIILIKTPLNFVMQPKQIRKTLKQIVLAVRIKVIGTYKARINLKILTIW